MKTKITAAVLAILVIAAIVLYSSAYVVEEGKQVIVTQFGKPVDDVQEAGLHFKAPFIQEAYYLEKRLLPWDGSPESMQTKDKKRIDIDVWARWRISVPMTFFVKVRNEERGQKILDDLVDSVVRDVVARHNLIDVVRKSNSELIYETEELERTDAASGFPFMVGRPAILVPVLK
jgi:membrane protease subunit HflC